MNMSFDFINAKALMIVQKSPDSISSSTVHMSRSQNRKHNLMKLSSHKDTRCGSKTKPPGVNKRPKEKWREQNGRDGFRALRLEGNRKKHWITFIKRFGAPKPDIPHYKSDTLSMILYSAPSPISRVLNIAYHLLRYQNANRKKWYIISLMVIVHL